LRNRSVDWRTLFDPELERFDILRMIHLLHQRLVLAVLVVPTNDTTRALLSSGMSGNRLLCVLDPCVNWPLSFLRNKRTTTMIILLLLDKTIRSSAFRDNVYVPSLTKRQRHIPSIIVHKIFELRGRLSPEILAPTSLNSQAAAMSVTDETRYLLHLRETITDSPSTTEKEKCDRKFRIPDPHKAARMMMFSTKLCSRRYRREISLYRQI
jgi:hypothetical protein